MGVAGLWDVLRPAGTIRSLSHIAVVDGFEADKGGKRGYRIGIDASIWFFHAKNGKDGENPELRTLFFRCATLMKVPFLPLFVFDGPLRPAVKRGKRINGESASPLTNGMKALVEAFGFEWRVAPGEAEAELAYLNRIGVIDGILSDDVDTFLFGATTVIRNPSNNLSANVARPVLNAVGKDDKNHTMVFTTEAIFAHERVGLTQPDLILIALLSGGDYHTGVDGCGIKIAVGLARCGYGKSLVDAAMTRDKAGLRTFLVEWRDQIRAELRTNNSGLLPSKKPSLVPKVTDDFPDIDVLTQYVRPVVSSEFPDKALHAKTVTWQKGPDLALIAQCCEQYFEWGYKDKIIKRFRTVIWPAAVLRTLHSTVAQNQSALAKIKITGDDEDEAFMFKIHNTRNHPFTDHLLEYRVEVRPTEFVRLAESGVRGTRRPEDEDNWKGAVPEYMREEEEEFNFESDEEGGGKKGKKDKTPVDPSSSLRVWLPASMLEATAPSLIRRYEEKKVKKVKKAKPKAKKITVHTEEEEEESWDVQSTAVAALGLKEHFAVTKRSTTAAKPKGKSRADTGQKAFEEPPSPLITARTTNQHPPTPSRTWSRTQTDPTPVRAPVRPFPMSRDDFGSAQHESEDESDWEIYLDSPTKPVKPVDMEVEKADWEDFMSKVPTVPSHVPMDISPAPKVKTKTRVVSSSQLLGLKGTVKTGAIVKTTKSRVKTSTSTIVQSKASTSTLTQSVLDIQQALKRGEKRRNAKESETGDSDSSWEVRPSPKAHPLAMEMEESEPELDSHINTRIDSSEDLPPMDISPAPRPKVKTKVVSAAVASSMKNYFSTAKPSTAARPSKVPSSTPDSMHNSAILSALNTNTSRFSDTPKDPKANDDGIPSTTHPPPIQAFPLSRDDFFSPPPPPATRSQTPPLDLSFSSDIEFDSPHQPDNREKLIPDMSIPRSRSPSPIRRFSRIASAPSALSIGGRLPMKARPLLPGASVIEISSGEDTPPRPKARAASARPPSQPKLPERRVPMNRQKKTKAIAEEDIIDLT